MAGKKILIEVEYDEGLVLEHYAGTSNEEDPWTHITLAIEARIDDVLGEGCIDTSTQWKDEGE